ncbi:MAG: hypothetical protein H8D67_26950 [Deltaproteobacteria bacterium]|nr:hypothetical protein [Deltaproteobacteria bacterium]
MKKLEDQLMAVVGDLKKLAQKVDKITKRVEKIEKSQNPKKTKAVVELSQVPGIDPAILARAIRGKIYPSDIILGHIIANPDGIEMATLEKKTGWKYDTIRQIIYRLRNQGKIKSKRKQGLRGKAYADGKRRFLYFEA